MHIYITIPLFFSLDNRKYYSSATMHHVTTSMLNETNSKKLTLEQRLLGVSSVSSGLENSSFENFLRT